MADTDSNELDSINHFAINVSDVNKAISWYQKSFRCKLIFQDKTQALLQFANIRLALVQPSIDPPHLAIERHDASALGELRDRPDGNRSTFLADSTGNLVEIMAPR